MTQPASMFSRFALAALAVMLVSGCDTVKKIWPSDAEPVTTQEGAEYRPEKAGAEEEGEATAKPAAKASPSRYDVLAGKSGFDVDPDLKDQAMVLPEPQANTVWPQRGATASNAIGHLAAGKLDDHDSTSLGDGKKWKSVLVTSPVVAGGVVYAMDAEGYISAHEAKKISKRLWKSKVAVAAKGKEILGGGLAAAGEHLFVTTGQGMVFALATKDGSLLWQRNLGIPVRSAPKLFKGVLYVTTIDDQLFALNGATSGIIWQHRGLGERVGFLTNTSPAINDNLVVVVYGSGEIYGLAADSGQEIWNDSLAQTQRTSATSSFTGFTADPVMFGGAVYVASAGSLTAATHLVSGQRIWDRSVSGGSTPWVAGGNLFQLTNDARLVAFNAEDGRIRWAAQLPRYDHEKKQLDPYTWFGPLLVNGELLVFGADGRVFGFTPKDGVRSDRKKIAKELGAPPIVADGVMYYVTRNAKLHAVKD